ncbi:DUF2283 domain-containing protein [Microbacterium enclense]|uniref:DUF2283 domain-containing protein n=1 Tax=Microbacterium enclense TaxID=993073 RepID=UPI0012B93827|nr:MULTISPECIES: DUF2283 domain-containing protein [Microbacterium]MCM3615377.1 DUF2283 domain-containing protein [Microbacterium enclense]
MRITYDADADAAYIAVVDDVPAGAATQQVHSISTPGGRGEVVLDFDAHDRLLGVEVLGARAVLAPEVLDIASAP